MNSDYTIRKATSNDARKLADARMLQLKDEGCEMIYNTYGKMVKYFENHISNGDCVQYIAEKDDRLISTAGVVYQQFLPSISWKGAKRGYITNVYTDPNYRKMGIASKLLKLLIEESKANGQGCLWLLASQEGKSVYENIGFKESKESGIYMDLQF